MNFEKIELQGFKSFADKTEIPFSDGITGIVGPNGCGKSNVSDAVTWVLGEQRPTALRGKQMSDVLFAGTDTRKATSYCEVSLHFDNSNKIFPVDYEKLEITRKLYRSGESEYLINRNKSRLKDVVNLLHDTGIGREGYSIIGQGKVEKIISAKPEDRRSIFEEAAGIAKFRSKKTETERKLHKCNENMSRLNDILHEKELRINPLKKQAEQATKYKAFKEDLKKEEVNSYIYQYENNKGLKDAINEQLYKITMNLHESEQELNKTIVAYDKAQTKMSNIDKELTGYRDERTNLLVASERALGDNKMLSERMQNLTNEQKRIESEIEVSEEQLEIKSKSIVDAVEEREKNIHLLQDYTKNFEEASKLYEELVKTLSDEESELEISNKTIIEVEQQLGEIKGNMSKYLAEKDLLQNRINELDKLIADKKSVLQSEYDTQKTDVQNMELYKNNRQRIVNQSEKLKVQYIDRLQEAKTVAKELEDLNFRANAIGVKIRLQTEIKDNYDGYKYAVQKIMKDVKFDTELNKRVQGVVAEVINVPEGYEIAIEMALGQAVQNIITEDEDDAKYIINYLKHKKYGRVTFLPLTSIRPRTLNPNLNGVFKEKGCLGLASDIVETDKKYSSVISGLLGRTIIADNIDNAVSIAKNYRYAFKVVTLDGDIISPSGSITGGSTKVNNDNLLTKDRQIADSKKKLEEANKKVIEKQQINNLIKEDIEQITQKVEKLKEELHENDILMAQAKERLSKTEVSYQSMDAEVKQLANELETKKNIVREIDNQIAKIDKLEERVRAEQSSKGDYIEKSRTESSSKKKRKDELSENMTTIRISMTNSNAKIGNLEGKIATLKNECTVLQDTINDLNVRKNMVGGQIKNTEKQVMSSVFSEKDQKRIDFLANKIKTLDENKYTLQDDIATMDAKKTDLTTKCNTVREKKYKKESYLERVDTGMKMLGEHIFEEYALTYANAVPLKVEDFDNKGCNERIKTLKRRINGLGNVNLLACEEYEECLNSYNELIIQKEDLDKAEADLRKIIADLSKEMETKFMDAFKQISANFVVIFKELFGGGVGELRLETDESEDILEAGIEIYAQPPGTKLQRISLLSGGQKALTAIAILFAILKLKPMPFCILDEIEAALDDANANLFAEYLRKFSDDTQFIVITHRKPTMELAHCLYGVTMQERGVSKMVSVKLEEALKNVKES